MTPDLALWIGITAGFILGATATWITTGIGIAIGRRLQQRADRLRAVINNEPPTDTFDNNFRALIRQQQKKP